MIELIEASGAPCCVVCGKPFAPEAIRLGYQLGKGWVTPQYVGPWHTHCQPMPPGVRSAFDAIVRGDKGVPYVEEQPGHAGGAGVGDALAVPTVWSAAEADGMRVAYERASQKHGLTESLFAVAAWLLRHRSALARGGTGE